MTYTETEQWILNADYIALEKLIRSLSADSYSELLARALEMQEEMSFTSEAQIKLCVAIIGTLAPDQFTDLGATSTP